MFSFTSLGVYTEGGKGNIYSLPAGTSECTKCWSVHQSFAFYPCPRIWQFTCLYYVSLVRATRQVFTCIVSYSESCILFYFSKYNYIVHIFFIGEIQGAYQIKVTTTALALLISTRHPELSKIEVQGHLIKVLLGIGVQQLILCLIKVLLESNPKTCRLVQV
jgi:hypothetical protein